MTEAGGPGPIASRTFDLGFKVAAAGGVAGVAALYWVGALSLADPSHVAFTLGLFPVYLLAAAVALGVWLGYETGPSDLKRVVKEVDAETAEREKRP